MFVFEASYLYEHFAFTFLSRQRFFEIFVCQQFLHFLHVNCTTDLTAGIVVVVQDRRQVMHGAGKGGRTFAYDFRTLDCTGKKRFFGGGDGRGGGNFGFFDVLRHLCSFRYGGILRGDVNPSGILSPQRGKRTNRTCAREYFYRVVFRMNLADCKNRDV